ncbi:MAG: hypothetical protein H6Q67_1828 [Firmicutes bacterium]|nr:hypothetical protein [Bacillota bacterium]
MALTLNSKVMGLVVDELTRAATQTGRSLHDITNSLSTIYPEILFSIDDWDHLSLEAKDGIISRIIKTLDSLA